MIQRISQDLSRRHLKHKRLKMFKMLSSFVFKNSVKSSILLGFLQPTCTNWLIFANSINSCYLGTVEMRKMFSSTRLPRKIDAIREFSRLNALLNCLQPATALKISWLTTCSFKSRELVNAVVLTFDRKRGFDHCSGSFSTYKALNVVEQHGIREQHVARDSVPALDHMEDIS